jgi:CDP-4-dehydro-6-deoxyglucose reductase
MVEQAAGLVQSKGFDRPMTLYWGGRRPHDLYMNELCERWAAELPLFTYIPVVSDALPQDAWEGRTGFVHRAAMADFPDMSGCQVYVCGAPVVVDASRRDFITGCGLPPEEFYSDAFVTAADMAQTTDGP